MAAQWVLASTANLPTALTCTYPLSTGRPMPGERLMRGWPAPRRREGEETHALPGLKRARLAAGLSQDDLARKAGCCQGTISHLEAYATRTSEAIAHALAEALGVGLRELTGEAN